jgi:uncharacterized protein YggE
MFNNPEGNKVLKYGAIALMVLAVFLAVQVIYTLRLTSEVGRNTPPMNVITVNGMGEVFAVPDVASFSFGVEERAATVAAAQEVVTNRVNQALEILKNAGIEDRDIKTTGYQINPHYEYTQAPCTQFSCPPSNQKLAGYNVSQNIQVKVRETAKAGEILGALGTVRVTNVSGISFTIDDPDALEAEARALAIKNAMKKAEMLVDDLDVRLGKVVSFYEDQGYPQPYYNRMEVSFDAKGGDMAQSSPSLPTGENTIRSNVSVTYEIR